MKTGCAELPTGATLHYEENGAGEDLVIVHGLLGTARTGTAGVGTTGVGTAGGARTGTATRRAGVTGAASRRLIHCPRLAE